jgi:hypothetical protein
MYLLNISGDRSGSHGQVDKLQMDTANDIEAGFVKEVF